MAIASTDPDAVCVVGTGPVGLAFALRLADAGQPVVLIDGGPQRPGLNGGHIENAAKAPDCEDTTLLEQGTLYAHYAYMQRARYLGSGGASRLWCVKWRPGAPDRVRLAASALADFDDRPDFDNPGWQVSGAEIIRHYPQALAFFGLAGHGFDTRAYGPDSPLAVAPARLPAKLFHFAPARHVFDTQMAAARTHPAITFCANLHLMAFETRGQAKVTGLVLRDARGGAATLRARHYVLALGGIETARQLLLAREAGTLADPYDVFGRWFCDHPHTRLGYLTGPLAPDLSAAASWYDFQDMRGTPILRGHEIAPDVARSENLLRFSLDLIGRPAEDASRLGVRMAQSWDAVKSRHYPGLWSHMPGLLAAPSQAYRLWRQSRRRFHNTGHGGWSEAQLRYHATDALAVEAMFEQRPSADNRIRLGKARDAHGRALPVIQWAWSQLEVRSIHRAAEFVGAEFARAGLAGFQSMQQLGQGAIPRAGSGFHHMGGARQSADPAAGVVDAQNRVHGVENLTLIGTATFPNSAGYANPTLTAVADAMRVADHICAAVQKNSAPRRLGTSSFGDNRDIRH